MKLAEARALVQDKTDKEITVRHLISVEGVMRALARRFGEDEDRWALAGLFHDLDQDQTGEDPSRHAYLAAEWKGVTCRMKPKIDRTQFGSVTIDGKVFEHDVIIRLGGKVAKRKKQLSKAVYGTSHTISLAEAKHVHQKGATRLIIGAGQFDTVTLSDEAAAWFKRNDCQVELLPTPEAIQAWNAAAGAVIGLLHVTC